MYIYIYVYEIILLCESPFGHKSAKWVVDGLFFFFLWCKKSPIQRAGWDLKGFFGAVYGGEVYGGAATTQVSNQDLVSNL